MSLFSPNIIALIGALKLLPGVGKKTAQRMALHLLDKNPQAAQNIADALNGAISSIGHCDTCRMLTEHATCLICLNVRRDNGQICVVENMFDLFAIEESGVYHGKYFVLHGRLSPLDGVGPESLHLGQLERHVLDQNIQEVVMALSSSVEGEATVHFISEMVQRHGIEVTRIGFGVPFGGELEYLDQQTLFHAFSGRRKLI